MAVLFTHKRLHVGFRARNWSDVWYEPAGDPTLDHEPEIGLYKLTTGEAGDREPMEGEVLWLPAFDIANCESKKLKEKQALQKQFLADAYRYLAEEDTEEVKAMEESLNAPGFPRWNKWFAHAKKYKKTKLRARERRRRTREQRARDGGATEAEIRENVNSDTSDDDSAYQSESETRNRASQSPVQMPPPPNKRKRSNANGGSRRGSKRGPLSSTAGSPRRPRASPMMSGALADEQAETNSERGTNGFDRRRPSHGMGSDDEWNGESDMDTRDPGMQRSPSTYSQRQQSPSIYNQRQRSPWVHSQRQQTPPVNIQRPLSVPLPTPFSAPETHRKSPGASSLPGNIPRPNPPRPINRTLSIYDNDDEMVFVDGRATQYEREQSEAFGNEEDAFNEAIRRSQDPRDGAFGSEEDAFNEAIRRSQAPEGDRVESDRWNPKREDGDES